MTVTFSRQTTFLGRNGVFKCNGVCMWHANRATDDKSVIIVEPITSKNSIGRCNIEIPEEDLTAVIALLQSLSVK